jgi:hypothetical protein
MHRPLYEIYCIRRKHSRLQTNNYEDIVLVTTSYGEQLAHERSNGDTSEKVDTNSPELQAPALRELLFATIDFAKGVAWVRKLFTWFVDGHKRTHRYGAHVSGHGAEGKTRIVREMLVGLNVFDCPLTKPYVVDMS